MHTKNYAIVTGSSMGIGLELAKLLAKSGKNLLLTARSQKKLEEIKIELENRYTIEVEIFPLDLSQKNAPKNLLDFTKEKGLTIDILINNAGFGLLGYFAETDWKKEDEMLQLNIISLTQLTKLFLPEMTQNKNGKILNVASTAAFQPGPLQAVYYATKAYVLSFSEAIASELHGTGVTVTALCPGPTKTKFVETAEFKDISQFEAVFQTAEVVAKVGYNAMMKGKRVAISGKLNNLLASSIKFVPRKTVTNIVRKQQKKFL